MNKYKSIAALVIRLFAVGLILYTTIASIPAIFMAPTMLWVMLPSLIGGIVVYLLAIPLAALVVAGIE